MSRAGSIARPRDGYRDATGVPHWWERGKGHPVTWLTTLSRLPLGSTCPEGHHGAKKQARPESRQPAQSARRGLSFSTWKSKKLTPGMGLCCGEAIRARWEPSFPLAPLEGHSLQLQVERGRPARCAQVVSSAAQLQKLWGGRESLSTGPHPPSPGAGAAPPPPGRGPTRGHEAGLREGGTRGPASGGPAHHATRDAP